MAQAGISSQGNRKLIYETQIDTKKAVIITFIAFLFTGFQCAIYGMLTVPISGYFKISSSMIVFYDSFGLWGQIIAMAIGGVIISKIKGKNTLLLAGIFMIIGSVGAILSPDIYVYTSMSFLSNIAVGLVLVSCYYMIMGTVAEEGKSEGILSILNIFFSAGFMISPILCGFVISRISWQAVFIMITVLFVIFISILLFLKIGEIADSGLKEKKKKEKFLTLPLLLTAIAFFLFVYVEQIMNYFNQPHMVLDLKFNIETVGAIVTTYAISQMVGRGVFGKFLLPRVKIHKYIIISVVIFAICLIIFLRVSTLSSVIVIIVFLGLADSCVYPSILGYGLDQIGRVSPSATSFMLTIGSIGIPVGTACSGLIGEHFGRYTAMYLGPIFLVIIAILIFIVKILPRKNIIHTEIK